MVLPAIVQASQTVSADSMKSLVENGVPLRILLARPDYILDNRLLCSQPKDQLADALEASHADILRLPMQSIRLFSSPLPEYRSLVTDLDKFDGIIVTSRAAATQLCTYIDEYWPQPPVQLPLITLGNGTAESLAPLGGSPLVPASGNTSEHLLALDELIHVAGQRILLVKGRGGRNVLRDTLTERGARVDTLLCYERVARHHDQETLERVKQFSPTHVIALSLETVEALLAIPEHSLKNCIFVVPSARVGDAIAAVSGKYVVADDLTPATVIKSLQHSESKAGLHKKPGHKQRM